MRGGVPGAAQHGARKPFGMARDENARHEAPHRVPEDEQGKIRGKIDEGKSRLASSEHVLHQDVGATAKRQATELLFAHHAFSVTDVVMPDDDVAELGKVARERIIALDVLGHPVDKLHDAAAKVAFPGEPDHHAQPRKPIRGKRRGFLSHDLTIHDGRLLSRRAQARNAAG